MRFPVKVKNLKPKLLALQKIKIFDFNIHLTVDGTFKDYRRNMPSTLSTWKATKYFQPIGGNICGISGIGNYCPQQFMHLAVGCGQEFITTLPWTPDLKAELNPILKQDAVKILKLHPRSLNTSIYSFDYLKIIETCKINRLAFGLCTFFGDRTMNDQEITLIRKIVAICMSQNVSVVFFHAFGLDFARLWREYGDNMHVYFETSFSIIRYSETFTKTLVNVLENNPKNVIFGSDFPDHSLDEIFKYLPAEVLKNKNFLQSNALSRFYQ